MSIRRGPRSALGATLALCGAALLFLVIHRQAELVAKTAPYQDGAAAMTRNILAKVYRDLETWAEAAMSVAFLVGSGMLLGAPPRRSSRSSATDGAASGQQNSELRRELARAQAAEASARSELAQTESALERARALLAEHQAGTDREVEMLTARIHSLIADLSPGKRRDRAPPVPDSHAVASAADAPPPPVVAPPPPRAAFPPAAAARAPAPPAPARVPSAPRIEVAHASAPVSTVPRSVAPTSAEKSEPPRSWSAELRRNTRYTAQIEIDFESDSHFYTGLSENLSEGGLFVATYSLRPVGTEMDLSLRLPGVAEPVRTRGVVRWVREYSEVSDTGPGMGLRLILDDADLPHVRRFLMTRPPLFFDEG